MISIIYGPKGTGKTKIIIEQVNTVAKLDSRKGDVVFITQDKINSTNIDFNVRCLYTNEFGINTEESLTGFVKGLVAGNADIEYLFIDGVLRIADKGINEIESFFDAIQIIEKEYGMKIVLSLSATKEELPEYMLKYLH